MTIQRDICILTHIPTVLWIATNTFWLSTHPLILHYPPLFITQFTAKYTSLHYPLYQHWFYNVKWKWDFRITTILGMKILSFFSNWSGWRSLTDAIYLWSCLACLKAALSFWAWSLPFRMLVFCLLILQRNYLVRREKSWGSEFCIDFIQTKACEGR